MPTYVYKCSDCNTKYEVFHKTSEEENKVACPNCSSESSKKIMSAANIGGFGGSSQSYDIPAAPSCASGTCGCNFN